MYIVGPYATREPKNYGVLPYAEVRDDGPSGRRRLASDFTHTAYEDPSLGLRSRRDAIATDGLPVIVATRHEPVDEPYDHNPNRDSPAYFDDPRDHHRLHAPVMRHERNDRRRGSREPRGTAHIERPTRR